MLFAVALFLDIVKLLYLRGVRRAVFTKLFCSVCFFFFCFVLFIELKHLLVREGFKGKTETSVRFCEHLEIKPVLMDVPGSVPAVNLAGGEKQAWVCPKKIGGLKAFIKCQIMRDASLGAMLLTECSIFF